MRGGAGHEASIHLEPVAKHVQHQQRQEAKVPARVQHAQRGQQARRRQPAALERGLSGGRGGGLRVMLWGDDKTQSVISKPAAACLPCAVADAYAVSARRSHCNDFAVGKSVHWNFNTFPASFSFMKCTAQDCTCRLLPQPPQKLAACMYPFLLKARGRTQLSSASD